MSKLSCSSIAFFLILALLFAIEVSHATALDATAAKYRPRERDRERAQARTGKGGKNKDDGLTPEQRRERDAKALQEKQAKKAGQAAAGGNAGGQTSNKK
ncbi:hypothetical protein ACOSQ2_006746 [Xanthoceras sorbifolium]